MEGGINKAVISVLLHCTSMESAILLELPEKFWM